MAKKTYNEREHEKAERRRAAVRRMRNKVPRPTWAKIGSRLGISGERARQLGSEKKGKSDAKSSH